MSKKAETLVAVAEPGSYLGKFYSHDHYGYGVVTAELNHNSNPRNVKMEMIFWPKRRNGKALVINVPEEALQGIEARYIDDYITPYDNHIDILYTFTDDSVKGKKTADKFRDFVYRNPSSCHKLHFDALKDEPFESGAEIFTRCENRDMEFKRIGDALTKIAYLFGGKL